MAEFPKQPPHVPERAVSLHRGANSRNSPVVLEADQAASIENMIITNLGVRSQRLGATAFGGQTSDPPGGLDGYNDASFNEFLIAIWGNFVYKSTGDGGWAQIASDATMMPGHLHQFARGRSGGELAIGMCMCATPTDTGVGLNGRSQLVVYNIEQDTATQVSLAPRCIAPFQGRLFYAEGETVGWSEVGDLAAYSDANSILVEAGTGGLVSALIPSRDAQSKLWILKEDAILLLQPRWGADGDLIPDTTAGDELNLTTTELKVLTDKTGCIATKSARWVPGLEAADVLFLADDGVRSLRRAENDAQRGAGFPLSYDIPAWIDRINFARAHISHAAVFDNAYHLAVPMDGAREPTHILRYDIRFGAWSLHDLRSRDLVNRVIVDDRLFMQSNGRTIDSSVTDALDPTEAAYQVYQLYRGPLDPSTSVTAPILPHFREESRAFVFGEPLIDKRWAKFVAQISSAETSRVAIQYRRNQGQWSTITETTIGGSEDTVILAVDALPWTGQDQLKRRISLGMKHLAPGVEMQMAIARVTGSTETGRLSVYMTELQAHVLSDEMANDE